MLVKLASFTRLRDVAVSICSLFNDYRVDDDSEDEVEANRLKYTVTREGVINLFSHVD
jgi:hypothetical protein